MTGTQKTFLQQVTDPAISSEVRFGIPAAVTISQAILESNWGNSALYKLANNPFGIKYSDSSPDAKYGFIDFNTHEFLNGHDDILKASFQHFDNLHDAFRRHALLLKTLHYAPAYKHRGDPLMFAMCLGPKSSDNPDGCGYATDPRYGQKLCALIYDYDLLNAGEHYGKTEIAGGGPAPAISQDCDPAMHTETEAASKSGNPPQPAAASALQEDSGQEKKA